MNPLMKENQILHMISDVSSLKKNDGQSLHWIQFMYPLGKEMLFPIPIKRKIGKNIQAQFSIDVEDIKEKLIVFMFDLSMHHYISNVKRGDWLTIKITFKECRGGRKPNFGMRTVNKLAKIIEKGSIPEDPF